MSTRDPPTQDARPLRIGSLAVSHAALLAPMAGYTDAAFRSLCLEHHAGLVFTEMTNARGLTRHCPRTRHFLQTLPAEAPVGAHLYGSEPAVMAEAAAIAEAMGCFALIDLNAGCPVPKIMARGDGAGLLRRPEQLGTVVSAIRAAVRIPVTVKTRLGLGPDRPVILEVARIVEDAGADALFLHARFARDRHAGPPQWDWVARVKSACRIPVIANGGLGSAEDVAAVLRQTGADGVMIGRAAVGNPWIFDALDHARHRAAWRPPDPAARRAVIVEHLQRLVPLIAGEQKYRNRSRLSVEQAACMRFRCHLVRYLAGFTGLAGLKRRFEELIRMDDLLEAVDAVLATPAAGP